MAHNRSPDTEVASAALAPAAAGAAEEVAVEPVFVYGTLKRGHSNHHWLVRARFEGQGQLQGVQLFDLGPFPMAVAAAALPEPAAAAVLHGELYRVSPAGLAQLDRLEGCPRLYRRHWLPLRDGRCAWVYLGRPRQVRHAPLLADGRWRGPARVGP